MSGMKVVGIVRGKSKKTSNEYTVLHLLSEFDDYMKSSSEGMKVDNVYVPKYLSIGINDQIELTYGVGFQGKAIVTDVVII